MGYSIEMIDNKSKDTGCENISLNNTLGTEIANNIKILHSARDNHNNDNE
jgi:hypothetical protein